MQQIDKSAVKRWSTTGSWRTPASISTVCPHCGAKVIFALTGQIDDPHRMAVAGHAQCPGCNKVARFWSVRESRKPKDDSQNPSAIFMYPPATNHYPHPTLTEEIPEPLKKAFIATIDSLNAGIYTSAAVAGRRTLEGIFKYLLPENRRHQPLVKLIEEAKQTANLAAPLTALSHVIRDGGNLGAHFDMEREPDEAVARQMVELLDYLISYLYVLPRRIGTLEAALGGSAPAEDI